MSDENYPGPGVSFGRIDQYLLPYWEYSLTRGMDREFGKEILKCFWIHCNTAYDAMIRNGNQGITAGFGQLITLSGMGANGKDLTNDLTYAFLEVIDEMTPILEPKPNVRLHRNSPDKLLNTLVDMISASQGSPFLLNFDERSMAGMMLEAKRAKISHLINASNVHDYAPVGCLENTMAGNDRSGTVDNNLNLLKAVELAFTGGKDLLPYINPMTGKEEAITQDGPETGDAVEFKTWEEFWNAYAQQTAYIIKKCVEVYEASESLRAKFFPTPYLSCLVGGCAEKGLDITAGGAQINLTTLEAVTYATTVDSLLAIKYLVFDKQKYSMAELIEALKNNWQGHAVLQAMAKNKAPKYGRDDDEADAMAKKVMDLWCEACLETQDRLHRATVPAGHAQLELLGRGWIYHGGQRRRQTQRAIFVQRDLSVKRCGHQRPYRQCQFRGQSFRRQVRRWQRRLGWNTTIAFPTGPATRSPLILRLSKTRNIKKNSKHF